MIRRLFKRLFSRDAKPSARVDRDEWLKWLVLDGAKPKTVDGYRRTTDRFLERWPELTLDEFTDEHITGFIEEASIKSRQSRRAPFANLFAWAARTRRIERNPMAHVPTYKVPRREPMDIFTEAEIAALEGLADPDGTLMAILLESGIRKAEARHLTVRRVDFENAELNIIEGAKGGAAGVIPISHALAERIARLVELEQLGDEDFFWYCHPGGTPVRRHDRPIADAAMHGWWVRCVEAAGVPYRNLHNTRHTYATRWRRRGLALDDVSDALRHADPRTTRRVYVHTNSMDLRRRMEAVAGEQ